MPASSADVVVLGGGPAGLTAAWRGATAGRSVILLERASRVGGLAASFEVAGMRVDHGSHRLHLGTDPRLLADLRGLLGAELQTRRRNGRLRLYDRWVGFPLRPVELIRRLPVSALMRIGRDTVTGPLRRAGAGSYAAVLSASLGPELYGALYAPFASKLWGVDGSAIDAEQARRRVAADTPMAIAARMLRRGASAGRTFYYPRTGFGAIPDALADAAVSAGASIRLGADVVGVEGADAGRYPVLRLADGSTVTAGHVVSTLPLPLLARLAGASPDVLAAAGGLRSRGMVLVYLVLGGGRLTPYDAHYFPAANTPVSRLSEPSNYRDSAADPTDHTVVCAEVPATPGDPLWQLPDAEVAQVVLAAMAANELPTRPLLSVEVRRVPHVYPVYDLGYAARLATVAAWADGLTRVTTLGRQGLFVHDNTHHTMAMAYAGVDVIAADGLRDEVAWAAAKVGFAEHVVAD